MKRNLKIFTIAAFLVIAPLFMLAQPPHPNGGNAPNAGGTTNAPVGAPVGNGTFILLTLAMAYAGRKVYQGRTTEEE